MVPFPILSDTIEQTYEWLEEHTKGEWYKGELHPGNFLEVLIYDTRIAEIIGMSPFSHGIEMLKNICYIADSYDPEKGLSIEEHTLIEVQRRHRKRKGEQNK